jgi:hypothetical protein
MSPREDAYARHQQAGWLRPDAARWVRPDAARYLAPNDPDNMARIPTLKHYEISGWYGTPNEEFGGLTPRDYLRDKDADERRRVGIKALVEAGVLKP